LSKHKAQSQLGDWKIRHAPTATDITVPESWWQRDKAGGYTFYDSSGDVTADFPPGAVTAVRRVTHALTGFSPAAHGGEYVGCACGASFAGTTRERAEELIRAHVAHPDRDPRWDYSEAAR
jgi:hypothetical protein